MLLLSIPRADGGFTTLFLFYDVRFLLILISIVFTLHLSLCSDAACSESRGRDKAGKSVVVLRAVHVGCHGSIILCAGACIHVAQRSNCTQRPANLRESCCLSGFTT